MMSQPLNRRVGSTKSKQTPNTSTESHPSLSISTPSSATTACANKLQSTPSPASEACTAANLSPCVSSIASSETPPFTPSSASSTSTEGHTWTRAATSWGDDDPDIPLPSVERDSPWASSLQRSPSTGMRTPSTSTQADMVGRFNNLRLTSPCTPRSFSSKQGTRTPSIHITASAPPLQSSQSRVGRSDSLVAGIAALNIESLQAEPPCATRTREISSPSPSRPRSSRSQAQITPHRIEDESPPQASFHMPEVQGALATAANIASSMVKVLSSSGLHRESGSCIEGLYQQATRLHEFQLPSSRIVGLVGDSGVGKSSLINSLLDREELGREVRDCSYTYRDLLAHSPLVEQQGHCVHMCRYRISLPRSR